MILSNIRKEFYRCTTRVNAGSTFQKACIPKSMCGRFERHVPIVHSKDAKVILRKKA